MTIFHRRLISALVVFSFLGVGCGTATTPSAVVETQQGAATIQIAATLTPEMNQTETPSPLTEQTLKNGQYELPDLGRFQLQSGKYESTYGSGATQVNRVDLATSAISDLNGDGVADAVVTLAWNSGGTGTFIYLAAILDDQGAARQAAVELLGDRIQITGIKVENLEITLGLKNFAPGDPACCPSQNTTRSYRLQAGRLAIAAESNAQPVGHPSPAAATRARPLFDPQTHLCSNQPPLVLGDRVWQTYAAPIGGMGGQPVKAGQPLTLNLRNKMGPATDKFEVTVDVTAPDGLSASARTTSLGNDWTVVTYPKDFAGVPPTIVGTYTVLWQVPAGVFQCDGFVVTREQ